MTIRAKVLILTIALFAAGPAAAAQNLAFGTFHSFKGVGVSVETIAPNGVDFNAFTVYADLAEVYLGNNADPGIKFNFSHNIRIADFNPKTLDDLCLFAGSGISTGWVKDSGRDHYGFCAALSGTFGARASFPCRISFTLGITLETGGLLYKQNGLIKSSLYRDGIYQTVLPHLRICYIFR